MDMFAIGCVWFEVIALFPLFPGTNEVDQINKIHNVLGTPNVEVLRRMRCSRQGDGSNFTLSRGTGIERLIPHVSTELHELLAHLLRYDPDDRMLARHSLKLPYFNGVELLGKQPQTGSSISTAPSIDFEDKLALKPAAGSLTLQDMRSQEPAEGSEKKVLPPIPPQALQAKKQTLQDQSKAQFKHAATSTMNKTCGYQGGVVDNMVMPSGAQPSHPSHVSPNPNLRNQGQGSQPTHLSQLGKHNPVSYPSTESTNFQSTTLGEKTGFGLYQNASGAWGKPSYGGTHSLMNTMTKKLAMTGQYGSFQANANQTYHPHQSVGSTSNLQKRNYVSPYSQRHVNVARR
eukprot:GEMP01023076.1.p1 GENE.GEMP01023076.1~~GEMP01023076.1.p1  ORF type:complete len:402 (+),score=62.97 GEMP01023076.1:172-1206(+)